MEIPKAVREEAKQQGFSREIKYLGKSGSFEVYSQSPILDKEGNPVPTGLPSLVIWGEGKAKYVNGTKALKILSKIKE